MTYADFQAAAKANLEKHIGDVVDEDMDAEEKVEEAYLLAFDGAKDAGATMEQAYAIATELSRSYF